MDTTVTHIGEVVVAALRTANYMESTIGQYEKTILVLACFVEQRGGSYTAELGAQFAGLTVSPRTGRFSSRRRFMFGRLVRLFDSYLYTDEVDLSVQKHGGGGPVPVSLEFVALVVAWDADIVARGLAENTRSAYVRVARSYLVFCESQGMTCVEELDGSSVLQFLEVLLQTGWAASSLFWVVSDFRPFLRFTGRTDLVAAVAFAGIRRPHHIIQKVSDDDVARVMEACRSRKNISCRDSSITLLAVTTGLRACDIIALNVDNIDWRTHTLSLVQQKTGNPLTLPLSGLLIERLAEYVLDERPESLETRLFLRSLAPHVGLRDHASIHRVISVTFQKAGASLTTVGTHRLRQNAATTLLLAGVALPTISAVLGHASPDSTSHYLSADEEHLIKCVLPLAGGVLA